MKGEGECEGGGCCPHFETRYSLPHPPTLSSAFVQYFYSLLHSLCILYLNQGEQKSKRVGKSVFVNFFVSFILAKEVVCGACFEPGNYVLAIHESPDLVIKKIASDQTFFKFDAVRATESFILFLFKIMTIHESLFLSPLEWNLLAWLATVPGLPHSRRP